MIKNVKYNNLDELKAGRAALDVEQAMLGREIIKEGKVALLALPLQSIMKPADPLKAIKVDGKINIPAKLFSYLLPLIINRTLFRRSNFMIRFITAMIARRIGKRIGPKVVMWLLDMAYQKFNGKSPSGFRALIRERRQVRRLN